MSAPTVTIDAVVAAGAFRVAASFAAGPGITALFGPSGSGKSVTLAAIAGLLRPVSGTIAIEGDVVADTGSGVHVPTQDRRLGVVFQDAALLPHRTPLDNVAIAVRDAPDRRVRRERARQWLERVHAGDLATTPTATLSGGEQQRVALARALAGEPRTLLLDEPFSALDQSTRLALRGLVHELVDREGLTALLVTHDQADVDDLADRVVRFEPGRTADVVDVGGTGGGRRDPPPSWLERADPHCRFGMRTEHEAEAPERDVSLYSNSPWAGPPPAS